MEVIFKFTPKESHSSKELMEDLSSQIDLQTFLRGNIGNSITVTMEVTANISEKRKLYSYYHKVILNVAMQVFTNDGYEAMDKVKADYLLKAECAKDYMYNAKTDREEPYLLDKSRMNKQRLIEYVTACITFLEVEKGARVPDSSSYKMDLRSGIEGFQNVNNKKK